LEKSPLGWKKMENQKINTEGIVIITILMTFSISILIIPVAKLLAVPFLKEEIIQNIDQIFILIGSITFIFTCALISLIFENSKEVNK